MYREDFEMLKDNIIYFDNGATTLKPKIIMDEIYNYYNKYTANAHRGGYNNSIIVDAKYENTRELVKDFINAKKKEEIIFTSGTTDSLNKIIFGYFRYNLKEGDEVLLTKSEHASNLLPWFELSDQLKLTIKYIELDNNYHVTLENVKKAITSKTKVISIAHVTNVIGDIRPIQDIIKLAHNNNILVLVDGAQSVPHIKIDVAKLDIDFLVFSAHKMCGPTGVGVIYGKEELLKKMIPTVYGGGMNQEFKNNGYRKYMEIPYNFEAGTPNIEGVISFGPIIEYLTKIGLDNIHKHEIELKEYLIKKLKQNNNIIIYNEATDTGIVTINYKGISAPELSDYLNYYNICVRSGSHCAKILDDELGIENTCRLSLYFYNSKREIDKLIEVLNNVHFQL